MPTNTSKISKEILAGYFVRACDDARLCGCRRPSRAILCLVCLCGAVAVSVAPVRRKRCRGSSVAQLGRLSGAHGVVVGGPAVVRA